MNSKVNDSRKALVDQIIQAMETEGLAWKRGWSSLGPQHNPVSGAVYKGGNRLRLAMAARLNGYDDNRWVTFNQAKDQGWKIKAGSRGTQLEKWIFDKEEKVTDPVTGEIHKERVPLEAPVVNIFYVFNAAQVEGIPEQESRETYEHDADKKALARAVLGSSAARIEYNNGDQAYYSPMEDKIVLPEEKYFKSAEEFLSTGVHEMGHSTGHESRLARPIQNTFGSEAYAKEELIAELASAFVQSDLGVSLPDGINNNAAYLKSWISMISENANVLFVAAKEADKAAGMIMEGYERCREEAFERIRETFRLPEASERTLSQIFMLEQLYGAELTPDRFDKLQERIREVPENWPENIRKEVEELKQSIQAEQAAAPQHTEESAKAVREMEVPEMNPAAEPVVTILWSESPDLKEGEQFPLSEANALMKVLDQECYKAEEKRYEKTKFEIDFVYHGEPLTYEGRHDMGDGDGSLIDHIEAYHRDFLEDPSWRAQVISQGGEAAWEEDQAQRLGMLKEFVPYLKEHCRLSMIEQIAEAQLRKGGLSQEAADDHNAIIQYVYDSRKQINQGDYERRPFPRMKQRSEELEVYWEKVEKELAEEAKAAGMTVGEYSRNGYEAVKPDSDKGQEDEMQLIL